MPKAATAMKGNGFSPMAALARFSEEQLVTLLRARPDLAAPPPRDLAALAARAAAWPSISACTVFLDQACRQVIEALCLLPQPTTADILSTILGVDTTPADLEPTLGVMADRALVFRAGATIWLHPALADIEYPANLGPPAATLLEAQPAGVLQAIARRLGVPPGRSKHDTVASVSQALRQPERVMRIVGQGPPGTADVAARLAAGHPVAYAPNTYALEDKTPLGWLAKAGLVVTTGWDSVVMPGEVGLALRGGRAFPDFSSGPPAIRWAPVDAEAVDMAGCEQASRLAADISAVLEGWEANPPKLLKAGGVGVRDVRRAATVTGRSEVEAARLIELAGVAGLAGWDSEAGVALPGPAYDAWLALDAAQRWGVLAEAWLASHIHVNLAGAIGTNDKPIPPLLDRWPEGFAAERRVLVLAALAEGHPGQAADAGGLTAWVSWFAPSIWSGGPARPPMLASWAREEAEMIGLAAFGALSTMGRFVAEGRIGEAVAQLAAHTAPVISEFVIQADLTVIATGQLPPAVRAELELMADLASSGAATVYRLGEASLRRAFDAGHRAGQILDFLAAHATKGVPQPLSYLIEDMGRRYGQLRVGGASCYLRSDDEALLAEILVARKTAKLCFRRLAPTVLATSSPPDIVVEALRGCGFLPAHEDGTGALVVNRPPRRRAHEGHPVCAGAPSGGSAPSPMRAPSSVRAPSRGCAAEAPGEPDVAALARRLRATAPAPGPAGPPSPPLASQRPPPAGQRPPPPASPTKSTVSVASDAALADRPSHIAASWDSITELLELAYEDEWLVRLEFTSKQGRNQQVTAAVLDLDGAQVVVGIPPAFRPMTLSVARVRWARVLTEAEEGSL